MNPTTAADTQQAAGKPDEQALSDPDAPPAEISRTKRLTVPAAEEILGLYHPVLDHGFVSLVDYMGSDESVEGAARVSYGHGTRRQSQTRGLIRYLRRHLHTTPSEMVELKFHVAMPIFVARQWIRHRTACLAEGTEICFDLPGGIKRSGNQLYTIKIEDLWQRFQPSQNKFPPRIRGNRFFKRDRVRRMRLRQMNESTHRIQHTHVTDVFKNGRRPVFKMILSDGKTIEATRDHQFLFASGWNTLAGASGLYVQGGRAVWDQGDHYVYVNGAEVDTEPVYRNAEVEWQKRPRIAWNKLTVGRLVRVERFEYVGMKQTYDIEVEGPYHNFVANGIVTHNSVNEYSARYSLMPLLYHRPEPEQFAEQSASNNQGRQDTPADAAIYHEAIERWEEMRQLASDTYGWLLEHDIARELARIELPLSLYTQWYWKIDLHNLFHFLTLRVDSHAQWEIQEYGRVMAGMLKRVAPLSYEAWIDYQVCGASLSHGELEALRTLLEAEDGALRARPGATLDASALADVGLSKREVAELIAKLQPAEKPDYELDTSRLQSPEVFEELMAEAVPGADK